MNQMTPIRRLFSSGLTHLQTPRYRIKREHAVEIYQTIEANPGETGEHLWDMLPHLKRGQIMPALVILQDYRLIWRGYRFYLDEDFDVTTVPKGVQRSALMALRRLGGAACFNMIEAEMVSLPPKFLQVLHKLYNKGVLKRRVGFWLYGQ